MLGPFSETLSNLQVELLIEEEPGVTADEVEAESRREQVHKPPPRQRKRHPGREPLPVGEAGGVTFFAFAVFLSWLWKRHTRHGPLEWVMRQVAG